MLILELLLSFERIDDDEPDIDPLETIRELVKQAMERAGITVEDYRFHEVLTVSPDSRPLLKICGGGCHPDLEKALEPLRALIEIVIFPDQVRFLQ